MSGIPKSGTRSIALAKRRELWSGVLILVIAAVILICSLDLRLGTAARMGPGFIPLVLGVLLATVGFVLLLTALRHSESLPAFVAPRPLASLVAAFIVFAALIESAGLALSVFASILVCSLALPTRAWISIFVYAVGLSLFAVLLFVSVLGLPMKIWP